MQKEDIAISGLAKRYHALKTIFSNSKFTFLILFVRVKIAAEIRNIALYLIGK